VNTTPLLHTGDVVTMAWGPQVPIASSIPNMTRAAGSRGTRLLFSRYQDAVGEDWLSGSACLRPSRNPKVEPTKSNLPLHCTRQEDFPPQAGKISEVIHGRGSGRTYPPVVNVHFGFRFQIIKVLIDMLFPASS